MIKIMQTNMKTKRVMLYILFLTLSSTYHICHGADAISGNQPLSGDQTIISKQGNFELGFFRGGNSSNFYIGIWYKKHVSLQTVVWVANRETPVKDKYSSSLKMQGTNLVLFNESQDPIWSTNVDSISSGRVMAVLRDDGNFVLTDGSSNSAIWQSFDNPTDTWLPGEKLAYNKVTNKSHGFISWTNSEDPAPGRFVIEFDGNGNQYVIAWNGTRQYFATGKWNEQRRDFEFVPELSYAARFYNLTFVDAANETYFTYDQIIPGLISHFVLDVSGKIMLKLWDEGNKQWKMVWSKPAQQCQVFSFCGEFGVCNENLMPFCNCLDGFEYVSDEDWSLNDFSGGCKRKVELQCQNNGSARGEKDRFKVYPSMNSPDNSRSVRVGSVAECESRCLSNCSCAAYAYNSSGCFVWEGKLSNIQQLSEDDKMGGTVYIRLAASEFSSGENKNTTVIGTVLGSVAAAFLLVFFVLVVVWQRRRRMRMDGAGKAAEGSLVAFSYRDLQNATKNFSDKLGGGGFGSVFRGSLLDSSVVAVKKLGSVNQGEKQFRAEVSTIGTVQHINLVRLRGFCSQGANRLLVYEYLENRSLDCHLFHEDESMVLSWKTRYQIALGTARGLAYLHEKCREVIIHCDIKPENILLDAEFCPKVADFGLAKLMGRNFSRVLTTMRGTRGYLAPEWISGVAVTAKADVYSYGMMVFELISGKRNSEGTTEGVVRFFPSSAAEVMINDGDVLGLLDAKLDRQADAAEVSRLCKVACWCIQDDETHRPSMAQVVQILEDVLDVNAPPIPGVLRSFLNNQEHVAFFSKSIHKPGSSSSSFSFLSTGFI